MKRRQVVCCCWRRFPLTSIFSGAAYSDALLLAFSLGVCRLRSRNWLLAGMWGAFATLIPSSGVFLRCRWPEGRCRLRKRPLVQDRQSHAAQWRVCFAALTLIPAFTGSLFILPISSGCTLALVTLTTIGSTTSAGRVKGLCATCGFCDTAIPVDTN